MKLNIDLPRDPSVPLLGIYPKEVKSLSGKDLYTPMLTVALFMVVKI